MLKVFMSDIRRNIIKIFCLTVGMAICFLLVAKIYFVRTYDTNIRYADRIFLATVTSLSGESDREFYQTAGGIGPGLKRYVPQVEAATRYTLMLTGDTPVRTTDGVTVMSAGVYLADSCFFDVFRTRTVAGNLTEPLEIRNTCVIPRSLAEKIVVDPADAVGMKLSCPTFSEKYFVTVGGVYEDFPLNTSIGSNPVYLSLSSIGQFSYDGRDNWVGNDRYITLVRMLPGTSPDDVREGIDKMLRENIDAETLETFHFSVGLRPVAGLYLQRNESARTTLNVLTVLAVIMLMGASLNYLLITISQMEGRGKEMAVRKCYGTSNLKIFARVMAESIVFTGFSLLLAGLLTFCFGEECRKLLGQTPAQFFSTGSVLWVEGAVAVVLIILTGAIPAWMYCRTPVSRAFRPAVSGRKIWKLSILSLQFFASGMLVCLLVIVGRQYRLLSDTSPGFKYRDIAYANLGSIPYEHRGTIVSEIRRLAGVVGVSSSYQNFAYKAPGNNIWVGDEYERNFNVADMYYVNPDVYDVMGIKFVCGSPFRADADSTTHQVIVEERMIEVLRDFFRLDVDVNNVLGTHFNITEHDALQGSSDFEVCGVVKDMRRGGFENGATDVRPAVMFPTSAMVFHNLYIRFDHLSPDRLSEVQAIIDRAAPTAEVYVYPYEETMKTFTEPVKQFGTSVMIVGLAIFIIALIGLTGFVTDEVQNRAREIAIRKVTGTSAGSIVRMLCLEMCRVAVPSLVAGGIIAMAVGREWLSQFTTQVSLSPMLSAVTIAVLLSFILAVVVANSMKVASANPVRYLRDE